VTYLPASIFLYSDFLLEAEVTAVCCTLSLPQLQLQPRFTSSNPHTSEMPACQFLSWQTVPIKRCPHETFTTHGAFTYHEGLIDTLNTLYRRRLPLVPTDDEIKATIKGFALIAYDALETVNYLIPNNGMSDAEADSASTRSGTTADDGCLSVTQDYEFEAGIGGSESVASLHSRNSPTDDDGLEDVEPKYDEPEESTDPIDEHVLWALGICRERFQIYIESTDGVVRHCLERIDYDESWTIFIQGVILPAIMENTSKNRKYFAFELCRWLYRAAIHPWVEGSSRIHKVMNTMKDFRFFRHSCYESIPDFELEICPYRLRLGNWDYSNFDEYELYEEEDTSDYEEVDITHFAYDVPTETIQQNCVICQDDDGSPSVVLFKCEHSFHKDCLSAWANSRSKLFRCPLCRDQIWERRRKGEVADDCERMLESKVTGDCERILEDEVEGAYKEILEGFEAQLILDVDSATF
jgi:hypothetical protein